MYIYGGQYVATENTDRFWKFCFTDNSWTLIDNAEAPPPCMDSHSMALDDTTDPENPCFIIFGGFYGGNLGVYSNEMHKYSPKDNAWTKVVSANPSEPQPSKRSGHASRIIKGKLYVFGGTNGDAKFNDLWVFDLTKLSWCKISNSGNIEAPDVRINKIG
jgi:hypothetical protein